MSQVVEVWGVQNPAFLKIKALEDGKPDVDVRIIYE